LFSCVFAMAAAAAAQTPPPSPENVAVPPVALNYRSEDRSLPELARVGVDATNQKTLMLQEAIELALGNNRDIEISRKFEKIAEFDLKAARGFFQPRLTGQTYYDRTTTPRSEERRVGKAGQ